MGLLSMEKPPECPKPYLLLRKLRMFSGDNGQVPYPRSGGYLDQPHLTMTALEACINAERRFKSNLAIQQRPKKKESGND